MIDSAKFKKLILWIMIGAFIACALVAVVSILVGSFNDTSKRALSTIFLVAVHSLICLGFIQSFNGKKSTESFNLFTNVLFALVVGSFIISVVRVWDLISLLTLWKIYLSFLVILFASLHVDFLSKALGKEKYLDLIIYINYGIIVLVLVMLQAFIFQNNFNWVLADSFFRILGAAAIVDGTLSILTIIFLRLHLQKNSEDLNKETNVAKTIVVGSQTSSPKKKWSVWIWILIVYLSFQIIFPMYYFLIGSFGFLTTLTKLSGTYETSADDKYAQAYDDSVADAEQYDTSAYAMASENSVSAQTSDALAEPAKNETENVAEIEKLTVGKNYGGGIIAYLLQPGDPGYSTTTQHGLVVAATNQSENCEWGCNDSGINFGTASTFGSGATNTNLIVNGCRQSGIAARLADDLIFGGYNDWYLPSITELNSIDRNINSLSAANFSSSLYYWTSSENGNDNAYAVLMSTGASGFYHKNLKPLAVRAIRSF
ncbi:MAG: DUF1566 domain-containing protein [Bacteroidota bacterium]